MKIKCPTPEDIGYENKISYIFSCRIFFHMLEAKSFKHMKIRYPTHLKMAM
jgi:hypothetical protein